MKQIIFVISLLVVLPFAAIAAPLPCAAPAKTVADLTKLVVSKCSPVTFDSSIKGQTLVVDNTLQLSSGVILDGESNVITLKGNGLVSPLVKLAANVTIQNITLTNPGKTAVSMPMLSSNNNKLSAVSVTNSDVAVYIAGQNNSILQGVFSGNTTAIQLINGGNNNIQSPVITSYQLSKTDETQWVIKGLTVNGQAVGGNVDLYLADANSATPQGKTYKASAVVAVDGSYSFTLPFNGKGTENAPYTLLVTDLSGNTSAFSGTFTPETSGDFFAAVDPDGDKIFNSKDNCPSVKNLDQLDADKDGAGDLCDNCPTTANKDQADMDKDAFGDSCDEDIDGDAVKDIDDNCDTVVNVDQKDADFDGLGDACDKLTVVDQDGDNVSDVFDNCKATPNASQTDLDKDGIGNPCDEDADGDGVMNLDDNCDYMTNVNQADTNNNKVGDICETANGVIDSDGDEMPDTQDNCPEDINKDQADQDADGIGDACEFDIDGDGVLDVKDNCPLTANADQLNVDVDALGDACDAAGTVGPATSESPATPANSNTGCSLVADAGQSSATGTLAMTGVFLSIVMGLRVAARRKENQ